MTYTKGDVVTLVSATHGPFDKVQAILLAPADEIYAAPLRRIAQARVNEPEDAQYWLVQSVLPRPDGGGYNPFVWTDNQMVSAQFDPRMDEFEG